MTIRVLGRETSINVRKVLWTCVELGLPFEHEPWGSGDLKLDSPTFRRLNPNALVPVLIDGDLVLWESNTICRYLAGAYEGSALLPQAPRARAIVEQWMDWQATTQNGAWRYAFMALVRRDAAYQDPLAIQTSIEQWNRTMRVLDARLAETGAFVAGEAFTLADVGIGLSTQRWMSTPFDKPALPNVDRLRRLLSARPGYQRYGDNGQP